MNRVSTPREGESKGNVRMATSSPALQPHEVAVRIRREHATIRALLDDVARACLATRARRAGGLEALNRAVWELYVSFEEHLAVEEALVVPILRARETFGDVQADEMLAEHAEQRRGLLALVDGTEHDTQSIDALAAQATELVARLRTDMVAEDAWLPVLERG